MAASAVLCGPLGVLSSRLRKSGARRLRGPRLAVDIRRAAQRKLQYLNAAGRLQDLAVPPGHRLEALKGDLKGFYSIRINEQWRVVFKWRDGAASDVQMVDYH
jgi:proteic killer suppression protein